MGNVKIKNMKHTVCKTYKEAHDLLSTGGYAVDADIDFNPRTKFGLIERLFIVSYAPGSPGYVIKTEDQIDKEFWDYFAKHGDDRGYRMSSYGFVDTAENN